MPQNNLLSLLRSTSGATLMSLMLLTALLGCHSPHSSGMERWDMTESQRDSADFAKRHHYTVNYNFQVTADSIILSPLPPLELELHSTMSDTPIVRRDDHIVVAAIQKVKTESADSLWIKVAKDQDVMGWVSERELVHSVVPNDSISKFIMFFSSSSVLIFLSLICLGLMVFFYKLLRTRGLGYLRSEQYISFYPTLFCLILSGTSAIYGTLRHFAPELWEEFYYYPTLNPFAQPPLVAAFLVGVWSLIICALSLVDDMRRRLARSEYISHLLTLGGTSVVIYLFFTLSVCFYVGYVVLTAFWAIALRIILRHATTPYRCGKCGARMAKLGKCPKCGSFNE